MTLKFLQLIMLAIFCSQYTIVCPREKVPWQWDEHLLETSLGFNY